MSRDSNGNYTLPSGNPVTAGTIIDADWGNATMSDIAVELSDSLSRSGKGGLQGQLKLIAGSKSAPGVCFALEQSAGWYRNAAGDIRLAVLGTDVFYSAPSGNYQCSRARDAMTAVTAHIMDVSNAFTKAASKFLSLRVNGSEKAYIDRYFDIYGGGTYGVLTTNTPVEMIGNSNDGASAVGAILDNAIDLVTSGAKSVSVRVHGAEKAFFDRVGSLFTGGGIISALTSTLTLKGAAPDGSSAVGVALGNGTALTDSGAKALSVRNGNTEVASVDKDGNVTAPSAYLANAYISEAAYPKTLQAETLYATKAGPVAWAEIELHSGTNACVVRGHGISYAHWDSGQHVQVYFGITMYNTNYSVVAMTAPYPTDTNQAIVQVASQAKLIGSFKVTSIGNMREWMCVSVIIFAV